MTYTAGVLVTSPVAAQASSPVRPEICRCFQCDRDIALIDTNKVLLNQKNKAISMRGEFFGNQAAKTYGMFLGALLGI